nr:jerky protein homolog-like [Aedes albopictus]
MDSPAEGKSLKRKHVTLTLAQKLDVIREAESSELSHEQIAKKYGIGSSSVGRFLKHKEAIKSKIETYREYGVEERRTLKVQSFPLLEQALFVWILQQRNANVIVSAEVLKAKAQQLLVNFQQHGCYEGCHFLASNGWARRFRHRFGLRTGDEKAAAGRKLNRIRYTFMPCSNMDGTLKLKLMFIGTSENPRDLPRNKEALPVSYYNAKKAWMTRILFKKWFDDEFVPAVRKFSEENGLEPKALLVLDNCSAHHIGCDLRSDDGLIEVIYLPPNVTSECQPMDQAVINAIKTRYKKS